MRINLETLPRRMFWAAAIASCVAFLVIVIAQIWIQAARPENPTVAQSQSFNRLAQWLGVFQTISIQSIWAGIALCLAGLGLSLPRSASSRAAGTNPEAEAPRPTAMAAPVVQSARKIVIK